jgi:hypothetical protein
MPAWAAVSKPQQTTAVNGFSNVGVENGILF